MKMKLFFILIAVLGRFQQAHLHSSSEESSSGEVIAFRQLPVGVSTQLSPGATSGGVLPGTLGMGSTTFGTSSTSVLPRPAGSLNVPNVQLSGTLPGAGITALGQSSTASLSAGIPNGAGTSMLATANAPMVSSIPSGIGTSGTIATTTPVITSIPASVATTGTISTVPVGTGFSSLTGGGMAVGTTPAVTVGVSPGVAVGGVSSGRMGMGAYAYPVNPYVAAASGGGFGWYGGMYPPYPSIYDSSFIGYPLSYG